MRRAGGPDKAGSSREVSGTALHGVRGGEAVF